MRCYPTLWNMLSRNPHAQELNEQATTHARFSDWKLLSKNIHIMMWAICNSLTRRYLPSNAQNNWLYAAVATKKKDFTAKSFRTSVTVSDDVRMQVKIGLHEFDIYVSQVKINVKQSTTAILKISGNFIFQQDSAQAHRVRETISFLACNLAKCWLVLIFYSILNSEFAVNFRWKCHNTSNA